MVSREAAKNAKGGSSTVRYGGELPTIARPVWAGEERLWSSGAQRFLITGALNGGDQRSCFALPGYPHDPLYGEIPEGNRIRLSTGYRKHCPPPGGGGGGARSAGGAGGRRGTLRGGWDQDQIGSVILGSMQEG